MFKLYTVPTYGWKYKYTGVTWKDLILDCKKSGPFQFALTSCSIQLYATPFDYIHSPGMWGEWWVPCGPYRQCWCVDWGQGSAPERLWWSQWRYTGSSVSVGQRVCRGEGSSAVWPAALAVGPSVWSQPVCLGFTGHTHENQDTHAHMLAQPYTDTHTYTSTQKQTGKVLLMNTKNR